MVLGEDSVHSLEGGESVNLSFTVKRLSLPSVVCQSHGVLWEGTTVSYERAFGFPQYVNRLVKRLAFSTVTHIKDALGLKL